MSRVRGKDTKPELMLRRALHALGVRFRVHDRTLPGTPDISHKGAKVAVFVDGCFWHGCPKHFRMPTSNVDYWKAKRAYVDELRERKERELRANGFLVLQRWECDITADVDKVAMDLAEAILIRRHDDFATLSR